MIILKDFIAEQHKKLREATILKGAPGVKKNNRMRSIEGRGGMEKRGMVLTDF